MKLKSPFISKAARHTRTSLRRDTDLHKFLEDGKIKTDC